MRKSCPQLSPVLINVRQCLRPELYIYSSSSWPEAHSCAFPIVFLWHRTHHLPAVLPALFCVRVCLCALFVCVSQKTHVHVHRFFTGCLISPANQTSRMSPTHPHTHVNSVLAYAKRSFEVNQHLMVYLKCAICRNGKWNIPLMGRNAISQSNIYCSMS